MKIFYGPYIKIKFSNHFGEVYEASPSFEVSKNLLEKIYCHAEILRILICAPLVRSILDVGRSFSILKLAKSFTKVSKIKTID